MRLSFDDGPKLATGGNGNGMKPPDRREFARPDNVPQNNPPPPRAEPQRAPVAVAPIARPMTADSVAIKAKRLRKLLRRIPKARMAKELATFRRELAAWREAQPGYDPRLEAMRAHESKIRAAFRVLHGKESV